MNGAGASRRSGGGAPGPGSPKGPGETGPHEALRLLRDRSVRRAARDHLRWIGRSVGWWSVAYLVFWSGLFVMAGVESVTRLERPLAAPLTALMPSAVALFLLSTLRSRRAPPVRLDRRDLIRLGLAPLRPWHALRWPFMRAVTSRVAVGLVVGLVWTLLAGAWFHRSVPWAAPATILLLLAHLFGSWNVYAEEAKPYRARRGTALALGTALLSLASVAAPSFGPAGALLGPHPIGLAVPALVAAWSVVLARRSLWEGYPPRFAPQSFVLGRLRALGTWEAMSRLAGTAGGNDPGERARLLAVLHDRPDALRPRRSLPLPPAGASVRLAVAWRGLLTIVRRPPLHGAGVAILVAGAFITAVAGTNAFLSLQVPAFVLTFAAAALLGGGGYGATAPLSPLDRTLGRIAPGIAIALVLGLALWAAAAAAGVQVPAARVVAALVAVPTSFVVLEKVSSWAGGGAPSPETTVAAGILAATPSFLATAFGAPELALPGTVLLAAVAVAIPV